MLGEFIQSFALDYGKYDDRKNEGEHNPFLNAISSNYDINPLKTRKLLITAGVYSTTATKKIVHYVYLRGETVEEISELTGLSRASVNFYLPY